MKFKCLSKEFSYKEVEFMNYEIIKMYIILDDLTLIILHIYGHNYQIKGAIRGIYVNFINN